MIEDAAHDARDPTTPQKHYLVLGRNSARQALQVMIQPVAAREAALPHGNGGPHARFVLLMICDPNAEPSLPAEIIAQVFALSPTEARVAAALCNGHSLNEYAAAHGVSIGTARFQLKQVLAKTHASRQADLVRRIYSSVIAHALPLETRTTRSTSKDAVSRAEKVQPRHALR
jgi:DNA-binding CsgD family transcriptional regulator